MTGPRPTAGVPITSLPLETAGRVRSITVETPGLLVKLSSIGLVPGATVRLEQKRPAAIIRIANTKLAIDPDIAEKILVDPL